MKIKLLFSPRYHTDPNDSRPINPPHFAPLGISILTNYLRKHSIKVEQDDLDIKVHRYNEIVKPEKRVNLKIFHDEERINRFVKTKKDAELEAEAEKMVKMTDLRGFDVVGLSLMPTDNPSTAGVAMLLAKVIKKKYDPIVIIGGSVEERVERKMLESGFIDFRLLGHPGSSIGEVNLLHFCHSFEKGKNLKKIIGVTYVQNHKYTVNSREYTNAEKLSNTTPIFDGLPMELYRKRIEREVRGTMYRENILVIPYTFIKGCPGSCAFCSHAIRQAWSKKDPVLVAEEIKKLSKKYKTKFFYFHNTTINPTYNYAEAFANQMIKQDVNVLWSDCANLNPMDQALIKKLKASGAARFVFGFEGASPPVLTYIRKNFTVDQAENVLKWCYKHGVAAELDMICGFPYERFSDVQCTMRFLQRNKKYISGCSLNKFWLEGRFKTQPEIFGINFKENSSDTHTNWEVNSYNETNGLPWKEKLKITQHSFDELQKFTDSLFERPPDIHNLFFNTIIRENEAKQSKSIIKPVIKRKINIRRR